MVVAVLMISCQTSKTPNSKFGAEGDKITLPTRR